MFPEQTEAVLDRKGPGTEHGSVLTLKYTDTFMCTTVYTATFDQLDVSRVVAYVPREEILVR